MGWFMSHLSALVTRCLLSKLFCISRDLLTAVVLTCKVCSLGFLIDSSVLLILRCTMESSSLGYTSLLPVLMMDFSDTCFTSGIWTCLAPLDCWNSRNSNESPQIVQGHYLDCYWLPCFFFFVPDICCSCLTTTVICKADTRTSVQV